jgi:hypothetical protein
LNGRSGAIDVEEVATALADQTDDEPRLLIDPKTGDPVPLRCWLGLGLFDPRGA